MVRLKFLGMHEAQAVTLGPAEAFRVAGNFLRELPSNRVLGEYNRYQWHVSGQHFSRYDCIDPCCIQFADAEGTLTAALGPFDVMHVADGTMYTGNTLFAKFSDETVLWHSVSLESYWPSLIITGVRQ
jgi:hypothetical protein